MITLCNNSLAKIKVCVHPTRGAQCPLVAPRNPQSLQSSPQEKLPLLEKNLKRCMRLYHHLINMNLAKVITQVSPPKTAMLHLFNLSKLNLRSPSKRYWSKRTMCNRSNRNNNQKLKKIMSRRMKNLTKRRNLKSLNN